MAILDRFYCISTFISGGHFVQRSETVCAIFVEGILKNFFWKITPNLVSYLGVVFFNLNVVLLKGREPFVQF